jgi:ATP-dependent DNA helicase RecG
MQLSMLHEKAKWEQRIGIPMVLQDDYLDEFSSLLPFLLTNAQKKAMQKIEEDLSNQAPMNRLIQGDVGSGKTIVAAYAICISIQNGFQSAVMAPTSILADQHYQFFNELLVNEFGILQSEEIALLVGATPQSQKDEIYRKLKDGTIKLIIGTHALIQETVIFNNLQLAIIDEQHRFGVNQRSKLRNKGENVNMLIMTATPIPRSLALTLYGDLNVTLIDELPANRVAVETYLVTPKERERIYTFIEKQIAEGNQAYIVVPLVDESDSLDYKSAVKEYENLSKKIFYKHKVGMIHGKMSLEEKESIMLNFKNGDIDVLVSTTVIEVGVDVSNATVIMIEGAERFGLAQLHQLRGRVGRGNKKSYCILVSNSKDVENNERLKIMEKTNDGFELAEKDLEMRGAGDFYGVQQSGFSKLQLLSFINLPLIEESKSIAIKIYSEDPLLENKDNLPIKNAFEKYLKENLGERS